MKVLVTGSNGMLGSSLVPCLEQAGHTVHATDIREIDQANCLDVADSSLVHEFFSFLTHDLVCHLAAETDVDLCERDPVHAYNTNTQGTWNVAVECRKYHTPLIYISTAGVFDGKTFQVGGKRGVIQTKGYTAAEYPFSYPNPVNVYGRTKLAGEYIVKDIAPVGSLIVRAGWMLGGSYFKDHKFVHHIMEQIKQGAQTIYAVTDKIGTPTYAKDFSEKLVEIIETRNPEVCPFTVMHIVNSYTDNPPSRYEVAKEILRVTGRSQSIELVPVDSSYFSSQFPAPRATSEVLESSIPMRTWQEALTDYLLNEGWLTWLNQ